MPIDKHPSVECCEVTFRRRATNGETAVAIVGEFNGWSRDTHPMIATGDSWSLTITLNPGRTYRFRYLLDDVRWGNDWEADDYVDNAHGGQDSVVDLTATTPSVLTPEPPPTSSAGPANTAAADGPSISDDVPRAADAGDA